MKRLWRPPSLCTGMTLLMCAGWGAGLAGVRLSHSRERLLLILHQRRHNHSSNLNQIIICCTLWAVCVAAVARPSCLPALRHWNYWPTNRNHSSQLLGPLRPLHRSQLTTYHYLCTNRLNTRPGKALKVNKIRWSPPLPWNWNVAGGGFVWK